MNEAERYLLERWGEARLLEESMEGVRTKYKEVFERVIDAVSAAHPELDAGVGYPTQFWGDGHIGFGRRSWPGGESKWPSGLWIESVRLERLTSEQSTDPFAFLWISNKSKSNIDFDSARTIVNAAAKDLLSKGEMSTTEAPDPQDSNLILLYLPAPSKLDLLNSFSNGDGQEFVNLFVSQFEMMARFVPVLDKVFRDCLIKDDGE